MNKTAASARARDAQRIGAEIRKLRRARGRSLADVARAIGRSVSFISLLERGRAQASIADLRGIADRFGVPVGWFFLSEGVPAKERGRVVRASRRRRLGTVTDGLVEELLSPDIGGSFETFLSRFAPGAALPRAARRDTEEEGYVVRGSLELWIGRRHFRLGEGDSFRIVREPFRWANRSTEEAIVLWVISPPSY